QPWTSRLSRRIWLLGRGCLPERGRFSSRRESGEEIFFSKIFSYAPFESPIGGSITLLAVVTFISFRPNRVRDLFAPQVFAVISLFVPLRRIGHRHESEDQPQILS